MATTYDTSLRVDARQRSGSSFWQGVFKRFVESRQKEANRQILCYLQTMDADTLHRYGLSHEHIKRITGAKA